MLKAFFRNYIRGFEKTWNYDASYMRDVIDASAWSFLKFSLGYQAADKKAAPQEALLAAGLVGTMAEDCGPCTQLMVTMALKENIDPTILSAVLRSDDEALPEDVWLGVRFARASLAHSSEADALRETIIAKWGERGLISIAFALTLSRVYPTLKYALGHGKACQKVVVAGAPVIVARAAVA